MKVGDKVRVLPHANIKDALGYPPDGEVKFGDILTIEKVWNGVPYPIYTSEKTVWALDELEVVV